MQNRLGLTLFAGLAIFVAACTSGGAHDRSVGRAHRTRPTRGAVRRAVGEPSSALTPLKVGVVTDVGQLNDKTFNQYSNEGAKAAAEAIGGEHNVIVTQAISDYGANIQTFIDQDFDVIVTVGFLIGTDTAIAAKNNPNIKFIGVDQGICVDETGAPDNTFALRRRRRHAPAELPGHRLRRGTARLPRRHRRRHHQQVRHDRRRRRHQRPGRRQLLARVRERREVGQPGHQGPLPGDRSGPRPRASTTRPRARPSPSSSSARVSTSSSRSPASPARACWRPPARPASTASASTSTRP